MDSGIGIEAAGVSVRDLSVAAASLRYFDAAGSFATALKPLLGGDLPGDLRVQRRTVSPGGAPLWLAWRSPSETLVFTRDVECIATLARAAADRTDGCAVDQTGGLVVLVVTGPRMADFLARLGSPKSLPAPGEARTSRIAELPVTALGVSEGEIWLVVESVYRPHLLDWMRVTAADF